MQATLLKFHRFLASQSFYPLVLSSLLAIGLLGARMLFYRSWNYDMLAWNLFLAWIPYLFSCFVLFLHRSAPKQWWLLPVPAALWLIFFPNAPYIVTDFLHLYERPPIPIWYDIGMLATFAWTGCFLAIASLRTMQFLVKNYLGKITSWVFVGGTLLMSGLGIYLGRFGRWNSWDLFSQPFEVVREILLRLINPLNNLRFFGFTLLFTAFLMVCYLMFASRTPLEELDQETSKFSGRQV